MSWGEPLRIEVDGQWFAWDGRYGCLLDWIDHLGLNTDSGCRSGHCHACSARLLAGSVSYDDPALDPGGDVVLLCSARPLTPLRLRLGG